jgi:DNA-binding NtrC family response regulator
MKPKTPKAVERFSLVGVSAWARQMREDMQLMSAHAATVLIIGPSGTGKELIARGIHEKSLRSSRPFVPVDCAAASGTLFTSQMFGHEKGAFTGASSPSLGAFRAADGGTIFLDELGELEPELQAKLLRTLQERVVSPVGGTQQIPVDVRVIAATNRDLLDEVRAGRFREDLYYRLSSVVLATTPLCTRREDLGPLCDFLLSRLEIRHGIRRKALSSDVWGLLCAYAWPGNARELENVLERATLFCRGERIEPCHLPPALRNEAVTRTSAESILTATSSTLDDRPPYGPATSWDLPNDASRNWPTLDAWTKILVERTLQHTRFNLTDAGRMLGIDRNALRRLSVRLGIDLSASRPGRRLPR